MLDDGSTAAAASGCARVSGDLLNALDHSYPVAAKSGSRRFPPPPTLTILLEMALSLGGQLGDLPSEFAAIRPVGGADLLCGHGKASYRISMTWVRQESRRGASWNH